MSVPAITDAHRGGDGPPLVLLHGLTASWRIWQPVLPALEEHHRVFAPSLPGHVGAAELTPGFEVSVPAVADLLEAQLDREGIEQAHLVGNSLGGWLALELGRRGRALSVVALSPAGAWETERDRKRVVRLFRGGAFLFEHAAGALAAPMKRPRSRRLALRNVMEHGERVPAKIALEQLQEAADCVVLSDFLTWVTGERSFAAVPEPLGVRVRIAWAEHDRTIPFERYGRPMVAAIPGAELVKLPGVGHVPMYDDPVLVVSTVLDVTKEPTA